MEFDIVIRLMLAFSFFPGEIWLQVTSGRWATRRAGVPGGGKVARYFLFIFWGEGMCVCFRERERQRVSD